MNLLKALATISGLTLLSRILGFVRDAVTAYVFGASAAMDAFVVAFRLPNLLRRLFAEGAFSQAFVPILAEYRSKRGEEETKRLTDHVATLLALAVLIVSIVGALAAPAIIWLTASGFVGDPQRFDLAVTMTRITFPYIFFMSLVALSAGILNTWNRFAVPAFTPVLLNVATIVMALFATRFFHPPILVMAWAAIIGGVLQLAIQLPALAKIGMLPRFAFTLRDSGVNRILKIMLPATLGVSVAQISLLINQWFASYLPHGSVSWLYFADRLMEFPSGMLGAAMGTILLPSLSRCHASKNHEEFSALLDWGLRMTLLLTLPAAVALGLIGVPLISTLFQHGAFTANDALQTRVALAAYSIGLTGLISVKILAPAFYSRQDIRTPVRFGIITLVATQLMNLAFIPLLKPLGYGHAGLSLSIGLASLLNAAMLFIGLRKRGAYIPHTGWARFTAKLVLAVLAMSATLWICMGQENAWLHMNSHTRLLRLCALIAAGVGVYFASLFAQGFRLKDFKRRV